MSKDKGSKRDRGIDWKEGSLPAPDWNTFRKGRKNQRQDVRSDRPIPKPDKPSGGGSGG